MKTLLRCLAVLIIPFLIVYLPWMGIYEFMYWGQAEWYIGNWEMGTRGFFLACWVISIILTLGHLIEKWEKSS